MSPLRTALAANLGRELTPELAAHLEGCAAEVEDKRIDVFQFSPLAYKEYTIQAEPFSEILAELHELHSAHWLETEAHRHGLAMNPNYPAMAAMEKAGRMIQFTVRHGAELVGNLRMYVSKSMHTQTLMAEEDTLYLSPKHRGGFLAMQFLRYAEAALRRIGVQEINANSKLVNKANVLMERLGYDPVAIQFVKIWKD